MRKLIIALALFTLTASAAMAQSADHAQRRTEMILKQAERFAGEWGLEGEKRTNFITLYSEYQAKVMATYTAPQQNNDEPQKELTDEEAKAKVEAYFSQQEDDIAARLARYQVQKEYYEHFAAILTPQQLARIFTQPRRGQGGGRPGQGGRGGYRGNGQGGFQGGQE